MTRAACLALCATLAAASIPVPVHAAARRRLAQASPQGPRPPTFKEYLHQADQHYEAKEYDRAIAAWDSALAIKPSPVLLFAIAQAHELAGRPAPALASYE